MEINPDNAHQFAGRAERGSLADLGALLRAIIDGIVPDLQRSAINFGDFDAVGDGNTDDTLAIQAALDQAASTGVKTVTGPAGTYIVTETIEVPAGVRLEGAFTIKQEDATNLTYVVSLADGASLVGVTVDGNQANNDLDGNVCCVGVANSDDCVVEACTIQNSPGYGVVVNTGLRARITNNAFSRCYMHCIAIYPTAGASTFHRVEGNYASNIGLAFLISGGSHDIIRGNSINGHIIGGPIARTAADLSGTTVTWVSGANFADAKVGNIVVFNGGQEFLVVEVTSATSLEVSTTLPTETGRQVAVGPGDLIGIVGGGYNLIEGNTLVGAATFGMGATLGGNSVDTANNTFANNNISDCGKCAIVVGWDSGSGVIRNNSITGNKIKDCGLAPGGGTLDRTAITVSGNGQTNKIFDTFIADNTIYNTSNGRLIYWLGTDGYGGAGEIKIGRNLSRGVTAGSLIYQDFDASDVVLTGWGEDASVDSIESHGHSIRFRIVVEGNGKTSYPQFAISKLVDAPEQPPWINGEINSAAGGVTLDINDVIFGTQSSTQGSWVGYLNTPDPLTDGDLLAITLRA
jgi:hypothetical protein